MKFNVGDKVEFIDLKNGVIRDIDYEKKIIEVDFLHKGMPYCGLFNLDGTSFEYSFTEKEKLKLIK